MVTNLDSIINEFMSKEYGFRLAPASIGMLEAAGFEILPDENEQAEIVLDIGLEISHKLQDGIAAKVFLFAYSHSHILVNWDAQGILLYSGLLGFYEYKLGRLFERKMAGRLFNKSLEHLLISRDYGNTTKENAAMLGGCYSRLGNYNEGLAYFLESRERGNISRENSSDIGACYFRMNRYEEALAFLFESRDKGNKGKEIASYIGVCYFRMNRYEEAFAFLFESRDKGNKGKEIASYIGECYLKLKDYEKALPYLLEAREKGDRLRKNTGMIGKCHYKLGHYEEALEHYMEAREKGDKSKENDCFVADCYFKLADYASGVANYERVLQRRLEGKGIVPWIEKVKISLEDHLAILSSLARDPAKLDMAYLYNRLCTVYETISSLGGMPVES